MIEEKSRIQSFIYRRRARRKEGKTNTIALYQPVNIYSIFKTKSKHLGDLVAEEMELLVACLFSQIQSAFDSYQIVYKKRHTEACKLDKASRFFCKWHLMVKGKYIFAQWFLHKCSYSDLQMTYLDDNLLRPQKKVTISMQSYYQITLLNYEIENQNYALQT